MKYTPGIRVRIVEDCREDHTATGKEGVYEGRFLYEERLLNPRIRLDNGEVIWGIECWWEPVVGAPSLEESKVALHEYKVSIRTLGTSLR